MHKYQVGQLVRLAKGRFPDRSGPGGVYEIVKLLPETNGVFGYRIKDPDSVIVRAVAEPEVVAV